MTKLNTTKAKIAKVAWKLFNEKGYDATTVDDIILESGTSKGSFYHYYSSKDELLASLSDVLDNMYRDIEPQIDPDMNSFDKLMFICFTAHEMIEKDIPLDLLSYLYSSQVVTKGDKHLLDNNRYYYYIIKQFVLEGQKRGQITVSKPCEFITRLYTICERAIIYDYCISDGNYSLGKRTRELMPLLFGCVKI
ncbi:MAG: TetR/AcrR family transcriptional regulator [Oscillospiraceae bacterium]